MRQQARWNVVLSRARTFQRHHTRTEGKPATDIVASEARDCTRAGSQKNLPPHGDLSSDNSLKLLPLAHKQPACIVYAFATTDNRRLIGMVGHAHLFSNQPVTLIILAKQSLDRM